MGASPSQSQIGAHIRRLCKKYNRQATDYRVLRASNGEVAVLLTDEAAVKYSVNVYGEKIIGHCAKCGNPVSENTVVRDTDTSGKDWMYCCGYCRDTH